MVFAGKRRTDERTRTAYPCSLRVITQALQGLAQGCKCRISKGFSFLWLAVHCTVLRPRWYQSGIRRPGITRDRFLCKPDAPVGLRKSTPLGRSLEDGTSKPRGYRSHEGTTPLYISATPRDIGGSSTFANYAVWESVGRFARASDNID